MAMSERVGSLCACTQQDLLRLVSRVSSDAAGDAAMRQGGESLGSSRSSDRCPGLTPPTDS